MPDTNFIKNLTSKDLEISKNIIKTLIKSANVEQFKQLCGSSDFIFPFLKDRIISDFVTLVNKEDLEAIFEFSKIYSCDFEDIIVNSWVKFASEDLTDEILELFEVGSLEQKAYAAKYFSLVQDPVAIEYLDNYAFSEFTPLKINCAFALSAFEEKNTLNRALEIVLKSNDDFEKLSVLEFISAWGGENQIKFVLKNALKSPFSANIISNLLNYNDFESLKKALNSDEIARLFHIIIDSYPESITLDTIIYYQIYDFIKLLQTYKTQYALNILLMAKMKFEEFQSNDIYSFDLDKNTKKELRRIFSSLESFNLTTDKISKELTDYSNDPLRFELALEIVKEYKISSCAETIASLLNERKLEDKYIAEAVCALKAIGSIGLIKKRVVDELNNPNIKALVESYLK